VRLIQRLSVPAVAVSASACIAITRGPYAIFQPVASSPRVVGLDDWSWKRRLRYGTLICDLESHHPIDVLPGRSVETVSGWFEKHPSVEVVSRDRSSEYAAAIKKGAPQAIEVAFGKEFNRER
jgi:transposase